MSHEYSRKEINFSNEISFVRNPICFSSASTFPIHFILFIEVRTCFLHIISQSPLKRIGRTEKLLRILLTLLKAFYRSTFKLHFMLYALQHSIKCRLGAHSFHLFYSRSFHLLILTFHRRFKM